MNPHQFIVGRDEFCDELTDDALRLGALLLFGAQKSGRRSILRLAAERWASAALPGIIRLPVLVDLAATPQFQNDKALCEYVAHLTRQACEQRTGKPFVATISHDSSVTACSWLFKHFEAINEDHPGTEVLLLIHRVDYLLKWGIPEQFFSQPQQLRAET